MNISDELKKEIIASLKKNGISTKCLRGISNNLKQDIYNGYLNCGSESELEFEFEMEFETAKINNKRVYKLFVADESKNKYIYNISLDGKKLFLDEWCEGRIDIYKYCFVICENINESWIYNEFGQLILPYAVLNVEDFRGAYDDELLALYARDNNGKFKYNALNEEGRLISENWFTSMYAPDVSICDDEGRYIHPFAVGFRNEDELWNIIDIKGNFIFNNWYESIKYTYFNEEYCWIVKKNGHYNIANNDEKYLSKYWFDCEPQNWNMGMIICINGKYNILKADGTYFSNIWFDAKPKNVISDGSAPSFMEIGVLKVCSNKKHNIIDYDYNIGNFVFVSDKWFDDITPVRPYYFSVEENKHYNMLFKGKLILQKWYDYYNRTYNNKDVMAYLFNYCNNGQDKAEILINGTVRLYDNDKITEYNINLI